MRRFPKSSSEEYSSHPRFPDIQDHQIHCQVDNLVNAMAAFTPLPMGQTALPQTYQDQLLPVISANWQSA
jgi:hypothetical protein